MQLHRQHRSMLRGLMSCLPPVQLYAHKMVAAQPRTSADYGARGANGGTAGGAASPGVGSPRATANGVPWQHQHAPPQDITELWLILEYCDKGSVQARSLLFLACCMGALQ